MGRNSHGFFLYVDIFCLFFYFYKKIWLKIMNIKQMSIQELESYFNLTCKMRDSIIMMARANNNLNTKEVRDINDKYNLLVKEVMLRINSIYEDKIIKKEMLNEKVIH